MDAIVIFRSPETGTAMLWCADQGALALLPASAGNSPIPQVGDLLSVTLLETPYERICTSWTLLSRGALPDIKAILRRAGEENEATEGQNQFPSLQTSG